MSEKIPRERRYEQIIILRMYRMRVVRIEETMRRNCRRAAFRSVETALRSGYVHTVLVPPKARLDAQVHAKAHSQPWTGYSPHPAMKPRRKDI